MTARSIHEERWQREAASPNSSVRRLRSLSHGALADEMDAYAGSQSLYVGDLRREACRRLRLLDEMVWKTVWKES